jgi:hypothetical protein
MLVLIGTQHAPDGVPDKKCWVRVSTATLQLNSERWMTTKQAENTSVALTMYEEVSALARGGVTQLNDSVVATEGRPSEIDYWNGSMVWRGRAVNVSTLLTSLSTTLCCHRKLRARGKIVIFCYELCEVCFSREERTRGPSLA